MTHKPCGFAPPSPEEVLREAVQILGPDTPCSGGPHCEGCQYEMDEIRTLVHLGLAGIEGNLCPTCEGQRYVEPSYATPRAVVGWTATGARVIGDMCPRCGGTGVHESMEMEDHVGFEVGR